MAEATQAPEKFPPIFWSANTAELFERAAYYSMASFVVVYLGQLGLGNYWPSIINSLLWGIVYFLPILSGTLADAFGFRRSLLIAMLLLAVGYFFMGSPVWVLDATLNPNIGSQVSATAPMVVLLLLGVLFIGLGGSIVKPCISGTVQKTAGLRATLAFAIFYMVINIGSLMGRGVGFYVRTRSDLSFIFAVATGSALAAFLVVLFFYPDPTKVLSPLVAPKPRKPLGQILSDMVKVLENKRFSYFLMAMTCFWLLYNQIYNLLPLYLKKVVETDPALDLYTMANPLVIVTCQLIITRAFGKWRPVMSIIVGSIIISASMLVHWVPILLFGSVRQVSLLGLPIGSVIAILSVALIAFGELFTSARSFEYIGALSPKGQEGLFLGYANLPMAVGSIIGGPLGAAIFNEVMCAGAKPIYHWVESLDPWSNVVRILQGKHLLELDPFQNALGWGLLVGIGLLSALGMWLYHRWLQRQPN